MFSTIFKQSAKAAVLSLTVLGSTSASTAVLEFDLSGLGTDVPANYYGRDGLYIGQDFSNPTAPSKNWTFTDVKLSIDDTTGIGNIAGTITGNYDNAAWGFTTTLTDSVVRSGTGNSVTRTAFDGSQNLHDILTSGIDGTGVERESLEMTLSKSNSYDFIGLAMPDIGHINVAELFFHTDYGKTNSTSGATGLIYHAWYQSTQTITKYKWVEKVVGTELKWKKQWYKNKYGVWKYKWVQKEVDIVKWVKESYQEPKYVGDTKAYADLNPVPLPAAFWLFAPALAGFTAWRRKQKA